MTSPRFLRSRSFQRLAAALALWSLLWLAILPLLHHPAAFAGLPMHMCHMASMGGGHPAPHDSDKTKPGCPICQNLAGMAHAYVPPVAPQLATPALVFTTVAQGYFSVATYDPTTASWPRAPPSFA